MQPQENLQKQLFERFIQSTSEVKVSMLLELKGQEGGFPYEPLMQHFLTEESGTVCKAIVEYLSHVTDSEMVPIVTRFISENYAHERVEGLVVVCWQSPLDFSQHLAVFVKLLISSDYQLSLEAFSVIENALPGLNDNIKKSIISTINEHISLVDSSKHGLLNEMVMMLLGDD